MSFFSSRSLRKRNTDFS
ncbi:hypothetical protein CP03DC29_1007A, partial [Chlamydia psittaci 03DC29]